MEEQALDLLDAAYRKAEHREIEGKDALVFQDSDAANAVGLSTAARDTPRGAYLPPGDGVPVGLRGCGGPPHT